MDLSPRDREILRWISAGRCDAEISVRVGISLVALKARIELLLELFEMRDRVSLRELARRMTI
jgi:DNA-binding CsgD family transcriptional regulator